jgi:hypothetical protein
VACCLAATGWENRVRIQQSFNLSQFAWWIPRKIGLMRIAEWVVDSPTVFCRRLELRQSTLPVCRSNRGLAAVPPCFTQNSPTPCDAKRYFRGFSISVK